MSVLSWCLALGLFAYLMGEAVGLHRLNVCRQRAWTEGTVKLTRELLRTGSARLSLVRGCHLPQVGSLTRIELHVRGKL